MRDMRGKRENVLQRIAGIRMRYFGHVDDRLSFFIYAASWTCSWTEEQRSSMEKMAG